MDLSVLTPAATVDSVTFSMAARSHQTTAHITDNIATGLLVGSVCPTVCTTMGMITDH